MDGGAGPGVEERAPARQAVRRLWDRAAHPGRSPDLCNGGRRNRLLVKLAEDVGGLLSVKVLGKDAADLGVGDGGRLVLQVAEERGVLGRQHVVHHGHALAELDVQPAIDAAQVVPGVGLGGGRGLE